MLGRGIFLKAVQGFVLEMSVSTKNILQTTETDQKLTQLRTDQTPCNKNL